MTVPRVWLARSLTASVVATVAACSYPSLPGGDAAASACPECQLLAVSPALANTGDTIALEGTFRDAVTVNFPGGASAPASVLGPHRASVTVPAAATSGELTITTGGATIGPLTSRRAAFSLGVGNFNNHFDQSAGPRQDSQLVTGRYGHTASAIGGHLIIVGGHAGSAPLASVEQAQINADGSLGAFTAASAALTTARESHASCVIGGFLYVVGGLGAGGAPLASVERAQVNADGSLGAFAPVASTGLLTARYGHSLAVIGNSLYAIGGTRASAGGGGPLASVERAEINPDGSLGGFAPVAGVTLQTARAFHAAAVLGGFVYILGGAGSGALASIERAAISADGSLGPFAATTGALGVPRQAHTAQVIGSAVYVFGGSGGAATAAPLGTIERASFDASGELGAFTQLPGALVTARQNHAAAITGNYLYAIGGTGTTALASVERAPLDGGTSLGAFAAAPAATVAVRRYHYTAAVIGSSYYAFGGEGGDAQSSVSRAQIAADGSLGTFEIVGTSLAVARFDHAAAVIGNFVYLLGGFGNGALTTSIERAPINPDGSLGAFAIVKATALVTARAGHSAIAIGSFLYVLGGLGANNTQLASIERAPINPDGSLGAFAAVATALRTARISHASVLIGNSLVVLGGIGPGGSVLGSVEQAAINADGSLAAFQAGPQLVAARYATTAAVVGGFLYVAGGLAGPEAGINTAVVGSVERAPIGASGASGALGSFTAQPGNALTTPCAYPTSAVIGDRLYVVAGVGNNGAFCDVQQAALQ